MTAQILEKNWLYLIKSLKTRISNSNTRFRCSNLFAYQVKEKQFLKYDVFKSLSIKKPSNLTFSLISHHQYYGLEFRRLNSDVQDNVVSYISST